LKATAFICYAKAENILSIAIISKQFRLKGIGFLIELLLTSCVNKQDYCQNFNEDVKIISQATGFSEEEVKQLTSAEKLKYPDRLEINFKAKS
jgi:hypothetical protein